MSCMRTVSSLTTLRMQSPVQAAQQLALCSCQLLEVGESHAGVLDALHCGQLAV